MPCTCDYAEPSEVERRCQQAAQLLVTMGELQGKRVPMLLYSQAAEPYCNNRALVTELCKKFSDMSEDDRNALLYSDARDKRRRALADWWEQHQEEDKEQRAKQDESKLKKQVYDALQAKLLKLGLSEAELGMLKIEKPE